MANQHTHLRAITSQDGAAILDTKAGKITTLNSSGGFVWQSLKRGEGIETIAERLARESGEPMEIVKEDVADFIEALKKQDLLPG